MLIHGDCLQVMKDIESGSVDMILADLPYGTTACKWDTIIPFEPLWEQYKRVIKKNGAIVLFGAQPFTSALVMSNIEWFKHCWYWKKKPIGFLNSKKRPMIVFEDIVIFNKICNYYPQGLMVANVKRKRNIQKTSTGHDGGRLSTKEYVQEYTNYPTQSLEFSCEKGLHPTQKPLPVFVPRYFSKACVDSSLSHLLG